MATRKLYLFAAVPQAGKTFLAERFCDAYHRYKRGYVFVYNRGKDDDFSGYKEIRFLSFKETALKFGNKQKRRDYLFSKEILYFEIVETGKQYSVKDINKILYGGKWFAYNTFDRTFENALLNAMFYYMSYAMVVFDDARYMFQRLSPHAMQLFGRQNHTGRKSSSDKYRSKGLDFILIYHNLDMINREMYNWATNLIMLQCTQKPRDEKFRNERVYDEINKIFNLLNSAPKYTAYNIDLGLHTGNVKSKLINTNKIIQHARQY